MKRLTNQTQSSGEIARDVREASSFAERAQGLLGASGLDAGHALYLRGSRLLPLASIHTFFMQFPIDAIFVDHRLRVKAVYRDLVPWRMTRMVFGASSVFELPAGTLAKCAVEIGDQLHVGD